jgi:hypothetical protein
LRVKGAVKMLEMAKGMTPEELAFNFTQKELYSMAQELNIKGRSKMDKTVLALNVEEQLNNMANEIQEQDEQIGYALINYHTGESIETLSLEEIKAQLEDLKAKETSSGFYFFLVVDTYLMADGGRYYCTMNELKKHEVKTAEEVAALIAVYEMAPAAAAEEVAIDLGAVGSAAIQLLKEIKEELVCTEEGAEAEVLDEAINCCLDQIKAFEEKTGFKLGGI